MEQNQEDIRKNIYAILVSLLLAGLFYYYFSTDSDIKQAVEQFCEKGPVAFSYIRMLDTVYLVGDEYIEIKLDKQIAVLHRRNDSSIAYKISSGTNSISKGIKTPAGFYTIQTKLEVVVSKQFNNAKLYYWLGFNGNIGFHGLQSSGYYAHLGRRPSSHGCVRIARNDAKSLYRKVHRGTPVLVYRELPAVRLVFADYSDFEPGYDFFLTNNSKFNNSIMSKRLKYLQEGWALSYNTGRPFIDGRTIMKPHGFDIGLDFLIPDRQYPSLYLKKILCFRKDNLTIEKMYFDTLNIKKDGATNK